MFQEPLKVKVDSETGKVTLSVRTTDNKVEVFQFELSVFLQMIAQFNAALEEGGE